MTASEKEVIADVFTEITIISDVLNGAMKLLEEYRDAYGVQDIISMARTRLDEQTDALRKMLSEQGGH